MAKCVSFTAGLAILLTGCQGNAAPSSQLDSLYEESFLQMDTVVTLKAYCRSEAQFTAVCTDVHAEITRLEKIFDFDSADSELGRLNRRSQQVNAVSPELAELTSLCLSQPDDGANIAMGRLIALWDNAQQHAKAPADIEVAAALAHSDRAAVSVTGHNIRITDDKIRLHFGAVAKGYAAGLVQKILEDHQISAYLLDCGSSTLVCHGKPAGRDAWVVGMRNPNAVLPLTSGNRQKLIGTLKLGNRALGVSGDYQRYFEQNGKYYSHILLPSTGQPARFYRSVFVLADTAWEADYQSTALFTKPIEQSKKIAKAAGIEALWVFSDGSVQKTAGFAYTPESE